MSYWVVTNKIISIKRSTNLNLSQKYHKEIEEYEKKFDAENANIRTNRILDLINLGMIVRSLYI